MDFFPLLIYSKRQTPLLLDCEHSVPFCGCWGWHGSNGMLRLQFRCGAPSLLLAALRAPEHKDTSGGVCSSWELPSVFLVGFVCLFLYFSLFFWCVFPCPVYQEQKYLLECTALSQRQWAAVQN